MGIFGPTFSSYEEFGHSQKIKQSIIDTPSIQIPTNTYTQDKHKIHVYWFSIFTKKEENKH